jgi:hypothetical protein
MSKREPDLTPPELPPAQQAAVDAARLAEPRRWDGWSDDEVADHLRCERAVRQREQAQMWGWEGWDE